jgi:hypothetical protein
MKKEFSFLAAVFVFAGFPVFAYQWPVDDPAVVAGFGQNSFGAFYRGVAVTGKTGDVRPIEKGDLVFYNNGENDAGVPSVLGGFAVIQHGGNLRSIYGHLSLSEEITGDRETDFSVKDSLGTVDDSGLTERPQLFLAIQDLNLEQTVNPYLILPRIEDKTRPAIRNVTLKSAAAEIVFPAAGGVPAGQWEVSADVFDEAALRYFLPTAVYRMALYVNGQEVFQLAFDAIKEKDGTARVYPSRDMSYADVYVSAGRPPGGNPLYGPPSGGAGVSAADWRTRLGMVQLKRGAANMEIIVRDFAGNERAQSFQFRVN